MLQINETELYYEEHGNGSEVIVFAHSLLFSHLMFEKQVAVLKEKYRCVLFDFRGQGKSAIAEDGYDMDSLAADAVAVIQKLNCAPCHFVGFSMGGFVGLRVAARHPELVKSLILLNTSAEEEPKRNLRKYTLLNGIARHFGIRPVVHRVMPIMFGNAFLKDPLRVKVKEKYRDQLLANHRIGVTNAVRGMMDRKPVVDELSNIKAPTIIVTGDKDRATVPAKSERMHALINNSALHVIPGSGHMSPIEEPEIVNQLLVDFLSSLH
jgi:pimeloyl-ACP methyl ester carboxylesterase